MFLGLPYLFTLIPFLVGVCFGVPLMHCMGVWSKRNWKRTRDIRRANDDARNAHIHRHANVRLEATEHRLEAAIHRLELADARLCAMESGVSHVKRGDANPRPRVILVQPLSSSLGNSNHQKSSL